MASRLMGAEQENEDTDSQNYPLSDPISRYWDSWKEDPLTLHDGYTAPDFRVFHDAQKLDEACRVLQKSPTMKGLEYRYGEDFVNVNLCAVDLAKAAGNYDDLEIKIDRKLGIWEVIETLAHEYRHFDQDEKSVFKTRERLPISLRLILNRALEADAAAFHTTVVWELKLQGYREVWDSCRSDQLYRFASNKFEEVVSRFPDALYDGRAARQAFLVFFRSPKLLDYYDRQLIENDKIYRENGLTEHFNRVDGLAQLQMALEAMQSMPYVDKDGNLRERPKYLPDGLIQDLMRKPQYSRINKVSLRREVEGLMSLENN